MTSKKALWWEIIAAIIITILLTISYPSIHGWFTSQTDEFQKNLLFTTITSYCLGFFAGVIVNFINKNAFLTAIFSLSIGVIVGVLGYSFFVEHLLNHTLTKNDIYYSSFFTGIFILSFIITAGLIFLITSWKIKKFSG